MLFLVETKPMIQKYKDIHPLLVARSFDHEKEEKETSKILTPLLSIKFPVCWCEVGKCWIHVNLLPDYF